MNYSRYKIVAGISMIALFMLGLSSCLMNDDLMTADAQAGGLVESSELVQFLPKSNEGVDIDIKVYQGPAIQTVKVYKQFYHNATGEASNFVLLGNFNINGQNTNDTLLLTQNYSWAQLIQGISVNGYTIPSDPLDADIGDYFILKYVSVMADGREVASNARTEVLIANSYAGYYLSDLTFFHPNFGTYPDSPYRHVQFVKELITTDGSTCYTNFALWGSYGETMYITINPDNSISFEVFGFDYIVKEGDPNNLLLYSHYEPQTGKIYLYYHYEGPGGNRIFWEVLEPMGK